MRYLLDTNVISEVVERPVGDLANKVRGAAASSTIVTSIIVASELRFGYTKIGSGRLKEAYEMFFNSIEIEDWVEPFDQVYADLRSALERQGKLIGAMDLLIAAHAYATDATVVTDDRAFLQVSGLKVENWLRS
jgi:tRNA(fMet)-specific endonuclease VapC